MKTFWTQHQQSLKRGALALGTVLAGYRIFRHLDMLRTHQFPIVYASGTIVDRYHFRHELKNYGTMPLRNVRDLEDYTLKHGDVACQVVIQRPGLFPLDDYFVAISMDEGAPGADTVHRQMAVVAGCLQHESTIGGFHMCMRWGITGLKTTPFGQYHLDYNVLFDADKVTR